MITSRLNVRVTLVCDRWNLKDLMDDILTHFKELGLNSYDAKVYLSLLKQSPSTGYEISKLSGIPQARAYETLKSLKTRQIVVTSGSNPVTYIPVPHEELLRRAETKFNSSMTFLKNNLTSFSNEIIQPILNINGEKHICAKAIEMVNNAKKELFIELWKEDLPSLHEPLKEAHDRGVQIKIVGYNGVDLDFGLVYQHGLGRTMENSLGGRWIVIAADNKEGLTGIISSEKNSPQAVWTQNLGIVVVIKEIVIHDMFLLDVENTLGHELTKIYGKDLILLRKKILGSDFELNTD